MQASLAKLLAWVSRFIFLSIFRVTWACMVILDATNSNPIILVTWICLYNIIIIIIYYYCLFSFTGKFNSKRIFSWKRKYCAGYNQFKMYPLLLACTSVIRRTYDRLYSVLSQSKHGDNAFQKYAAAPPWTSC